MQYVLVQQGLQKALDGKSKKPTSMTEEDWEDLDARALNTICLCLEDEVLFNITEETTTTGLWTKLEILYMTKNLSNIIFLKRQLHNLQIKEDVIDYDMVVGALLYEEIRKTSGKETSIEEEMVVKGRSKKDGNIRKVQPGLSQKTVRVRQNVGFVANLGISRRIVGKDNKHPKNTLLKKQIQL
jgi:hypothetical protein